MKDTWPNTVNFLLLLALALVSWAFYKLHLQRLLAQGRVGRIKIALVVLGIIFIALALTGRAPALFALLGAAMTQLMRLLPLLLKFAPSLFARFSGAPSMGQSGTTRNGTSQVHTRTIVMNLDHASGQVNGNVVDGAYNGKQLSDLSPQDILTLHEYCASHDADAQKLLVTYVSRERPDLLDQLGVEETANEGGETRDNTDELSTVEAREILGVSDNATREDVIAAHRLLMAKLHPDKGGSNWLASRVNAARAKLLENG